MHRFIFPIYTYNTIHFTLIPLPCINDRKHISMGNICFNLGQLGQRALPARQLIVMICGSKPLGGGHVASHSFSVLDFE